MNLFLLPAEIGNMYAEEGLEKPVTGVTGFWFLIPLVGMHHLVREGAGRDEPALGSERRDLDPRTSV